MKKARKKNSHELEACDCFKESKNENNKCPYQEFPDGFPFVPTVGNGQVRGEIFTPLFIVNKMIVDSGIMPKEAVYDFTYKNVENIKEILSARIVEPAVGTGNYTVTIILHKMRYAEIDAIENKKLNLNEYHKNILTAISSMYSFDISAGNLETTKRRILNTTNPIPLNSKKANEYWINYLLEKLNFNAKNKKTKKALNGIEAFIKESLDEAQKNWWHPVEKGVGIVDHEYEKAVGRKLPEFLRNEIENILNTNILLFNGIKDEDTFDVDNSFFTPGRQNVEWTWREYTSVNESNIDLKIKKVKLEVQILRSKLKDNNIKEKEKKSINARLLELGEYSSLSGTLNF